MESSAQWSPHFRIWGILYFCQEVSLLDSQVRAFRFICYHSCFVCILGIFTSHKSKANLLLLRLVTTQPLMCLFHCLIKFRQRAELTRQPHLPKEAKGKGTRSSAKWSSKQYKDQPIFKIISFNFPRL